MLGRSFYWTVCSTYLLIGNAGSLALAQMSDGFTEPGDAVSLLVYKLVQEELNLSDSQRRAAEEHNLEFREALKKVYASNVPEDERQRSQRETIERANDKSFDLVSEKQRERLWQISLQVREDAIKYSLADVLLFDEQLRKALKISEEQAAKIREVEAENLDARKKVRQAMEAIRFKSAREQQDYVFEQIGKEALQRQINVLTPMQKAELDKLKGPKFEYPREDLPL